MSQENRKKLSNDEFKQVIALFAWLRNIRDLRDTRVDTIEPLNELNFCVDDVQENLEKNL